jgi:rSAM/selenodomain-associated transferase 1
MPPTSTETRVIVFTKAPRPGAVKSRLIPLLGAEAAATLQARLIERTLSTACAAGVGPVELCCAPHTDDPFFTTCVSRYPISLAPQADGDLGARMTAAFTRALLDAGSVILIGTDCPALTALHLTQAAQALAGSSDAVLVPAADGGYVLIGLKRCDVLLFHNIEWGSATVMGATRERLRRLQWRWKELETLWDVDRPEDYRRLLAAGLLGPLEHANNG